jgi:hypothetical protein
VRRSESLTTVSRLAIAESISTCIAA